MFDYEKLNVYQKAKEMNFFIYKTLIDIRNVDPADSDQLKRASLSMVLNLVEGTGRESAKDKKHFYVMSKSSALETSF